MDRRAFLELVSSGTLPLVSGCIGSLQEGSGSSMDGVTTQPPNTPIRTGWFPESPNRWYRAMITFIQGLRTPWESDPSVFAEDYSDRLRELALDIIVPGVREVLGTADDMADIVKATGDSFHLLNEAWAVQQIEQYRAEWCRNITGDVVTNQYKQLDRRSDDISIDTSSCRVIKPLFDAVIQAFSGFDSTTTSVDRKRHIRGTVKKVLDIFNVVQLTLSGSASAVIDDVRVPLNDNLRTYQSSLRVLENALTFDISESQPDQSGPSVPNPEFVSIDLPDQIYRYSPFELSVHVRNTGSMGGHWSTITVSFPRLTASTANEQITITAEDFHEWKTVATDGAQITDRNGNRIDARYALAEAGTDGDSYWAGGEDHRLAIEAVTEHSGTFPILVRATLTAEDNVNKKYTAPSQANADTIDQQKYPVRKFNLEIAE